MTLTGLFKINTNVHNISTLSKINLKQVDKQLINK
jgi:hypothetical protein